MSKHEEIYRLLVNEIQDYAIFMMDPDGYVRTWNLGAERVKGYTAAEIIGSHYSRFFRPEDVENGRPAYLLATALAKGRVEDEGWRVKKDGSLFWASTVLTALYNDEGRHFGFVKITQDITTRRQAEIELRELHAELERRVRERTAQLATANRELAEANRMKDDFLATLSHELRTPLTAAFGWVQLMLAGTMDGIQQRKGLEIIDRNLRAQIKLIDDLLNISHIVAGRIRLDLREVDALQIIRTAVDSIRPEAREKSIHLRFSTSRAIGVVNTIVDPARLQQIVSNLLSNAVKFTPPNGRIDVILERSGDSAVFTVSDTGEGISPEFLPHVFDRFRQADSSQARKHGGLGIGLALVRQLVELHGGTVEAESAGKGKGATFTVTLPTHDARGFLGETPKFPRPA
jgi:PAS domain S-box-containing protein